MLAQLLGQRELWSALMGRPFSEAAKRTAEESIETAGHLMICFGVVETFYLRAQEEADKR